MTPRLSLISPDGHPRVLVMGVLNLTPDSFSDGGRFNDLDSALVHAEAMVREGADILDVGGESTRPGAEPVAEAEELGRVVRVIEALRQRFGQPISVDTSKPAVMRAAVAAGADMINDVQALRQPGSLDAAQKLGVHVCLMHMQGEPRTMQLDPKYDDVTAEVSDFLRARVQACIDVGVPREFLILDPGFGFGKQLTHNLTLLRELDRIVGLGYPVLVGLSRKAMVGSITNKPAGQRLFGSVALAVYAALKGARILRVHDVGPTVDALRAIDAVVKG